MRPPSLPKARPAMTAGSGLSRRPRDRRWYVLIFLVQVYLWGTFLLFWLGPYVKDAQGLGLLCVFVTAAHLALLLGYRFGLSRQRDLTKVVSWPPISDALIRTIIVISAIHHILFGAALLKEFGYSDLGSLVRTIMNPGEAYFAKFQVYEDQLAREGRPNVLLQVLTLTYVVSYFLIPCAVVYWRRLSFWVQCLAIAGVGMYGVYFAFVGTQKGLGDIIILALSGYLVRRYRGLPGPKPSWSSSRRLRWAIALSFIAFFLYMSQNQLDRLRQWDGEDRARYAAEGSLIHSLLGEELGFRVSLVISYPTHGYCGLSHSLQMPFVWTYGLSTSRSLASYLTQYCGVPDEFDRTYLARAEAETGWPALMYWSTIYPWLASDVTFPGTLVLMFLLGWLAAKAWYEALRGDLISLIVVSQFVMCILYIPANNQLLQSRTGFCGTIALALLYAVSRLHRPEAVGHRVTFPRLNPCGKC